MKKEIGGNLLKFLFFGMCCYGIIRVSIWSYFQTQAFFIPFDGINGNSVISNGLALVSQYGQNVVLFLATIEAGRRLAYRNKIGNISGQRTHIAILEDEISKSQTSSYIYYALFVVFALIDSGTNVGQFESTTLKVAKETMVGFSLFSFMWVGRLISVVVVFVEELFMNTANALLHAFNDLLESMGWKRIPSLDLFVDPDKIIAIRMDERNGKQSTQGDTFRYDKPKTIQVKPEYPIPKKEEPKPEEADVPDFIKRMRAEEKKYKPAPTNQFQPHNKKHKRR